MKRLIALFVFTLMSTIGIATLSHAAGDMTAVGTKTVKGDLLKIEGEFYTVHDTAGHKVRLHVDKTSKLEGTFKTGDKVEAQVTVNSHALSIKHAQGIGGGMAALGPQTVKGDL